MNIPLTIIGIGNESPAALSPEARKHIESAKILKGGKRHLSFFSDWVGEKIVLEGNLEEFATKILSRYPQEKTVLLASGDPLFYGIGKYLLQKAPQEDLQFIPGISSIQLAFARIKESWDDARVVSLHGRPIENLLPALQQGEKKIGIFTDSKNNPERIASFLMEHGFDHYAIWVCEELGGEGEKFSFWNLKDIQGKEFSDLNVVILKQTREVANPSPSSLPLFGIPESALTDGTMITKKEIRLISLCALELHSSDILWDIGSATASIALEAVHHGDGPMVFAVEKDKSSFEKLSENLKKFKALRVTAFHGEAPKILSELPDPDAVFIGGTGGRLSEILETIHQRLKPGGRIVMNCITIENFSKGWEKLNALGFSTSAQSIQISNSQALGPSHRFQTSSPIFILKAKKNESV